MQLYLDNLLPVISFPTQIRCDPVPDGPKRLVFDGLGVDGGGAVDGLFDLAGDADDEGIFGDDGVFFDEGAGGDDGAAADGGTGEDGGVHADEDVVFDGAGVDDGAVADGHETADEAWAVILDVQAGRVLYIGVRANPDTADVAAHDGCGPDARVLADFDIAEDDGTGGEESFFVDFRGVALIGCAV